MTALSMPTMPGGGLAQSDPPPMPPLPTPDTSIPHAPPPPSLPPLPPFEVIAAFVIGGFLVFGWFWTHPRQLLRVASWPVRLETWLWMTSGALIADHGGRRTQSARRYIRTWAAQTLPDALAPAPAQTVADERTYLRVRPAADTFEPAALVDALRKVHGSPAGGLFGSAARFEFLIAGTGEPDHPIEFYLGGPRDQLDHLGAYDPDTFDIEEVSFHPAEALSARLDINPAEAANPTDALLNELAATGIEPVTYRFGTWAYRWKDWMMRLVGLTETLDNDRDDEPPVHPLNDVIDQIGQLNEQGVAAIYQVTFTPFRGWHRQAKQRKKRLRSHADTLKERIEQFELPKGEQHDAAEAAYRAEKYEQHRAEPTLDIGGVAGQRFEQLHDKETENTFVGNVRVSAIPTADMSRADVADQVRQIEPALRGFERDFYHFQSLPSRWLERLSGLFRVRGARHRVRLRRLCERQLVTPTFGHRPWNLRRRWPDVICNPDELAALASVPCTAHLRTEASTGPYMESQPEHTRALRELTPTQRAKYLDANGMWLGHLLNADGSALQEASLSLPVAEQFIHILEAGASGTGKTTNAIKRALTAFATTTGPTILVTGLGGNLAENYMRAHAALFGVDSLNTHVHHFDFPEGMPGFTFFDLRKMESPYREFADREDAVQHQISRYLAILHHLMPAEKLAEAPNSVTVLENLVRAGFDEAHWHENMPLREDRDYFAQWQLQALRARFYHAHPETWGSADPPQLSNWSYNQNLQEQLTAPGETFGAVMTGVRNRMDQLIRDNRYQQLMNNTEPQFSFTDVLGPDRDPDLLPDDRGVFIFDLSDIQEERQKGLALLLLTELFTSLKTYKEWLAGATVETAGVTQPAADGGAEPRQPGTGPTTPPGADDNPSAWDSATDGATGIPTTPADTSWKTEDSPTDGQIPADWVTNAIVDEAAVVAGIDLVSKLLREARNLRVSMHLLMQYPKQLEEQIGTEAYNEMLNNVQTRILGPHNLDDEVAAQVLPQGMATTEFRRQIGDLSRSHRVVQLSPQDDGDRPQPFTIHRGPLPPGHLAAPLSADADESLPYTEREIRDAIDAVTTQTQEEYGLPPDLAVGPPPVTVPEDLQTATGLGALDTPEVLTLMVRHAQQATDASAANPWATIERVLGRFRLWLGDEENADRRVAPGADESPPSADSGSTGDTDEASDTADDGAGEAVETDKTTSGHTVSDSELVTMMESSPYLELTAAAERPEIEADNGLYVRLTATGQEVMDALQETGETGAAGGAEHDAMLAGIEAALVRYGFEVIRPTQDLTEQPDAWARHLDISFELVIEVEHSGLDHPDKPLLNLRYAQQTGAFPLFVVASSASACDEEVTANAVRLANILSDPVRARTDEETRFYTYTNRLVTAHGGARNDGETAVRPVAGSEDSRRTVWTQPHGEDVYVYKNPAGEDCVFESVADAPLGAFPAYYTYTQTPEGEVHYTVHEGGDTYEYDSKPAFDAEWETVQYPFIPEEELPVPDYDAETYAIVILEDDGEPATATALLYDPATNDTAPLEELVDGMTAETEDFAPAIGSSGSDPPRSDSDKNGASVDTTHNQSAPPEAQDASSSEVSETDSASPAESVADTPTAGEADLTPEQRSVNEFATLLEGADPETVESLNVEALGPEDVGDVLTGREVFAVYQLVQTYREQPLYTQPRHFARQLSNELQFASKQLRDPADPDSRPTYWVGLSWQPTAAPAATKLLAILNEIVNTLTDVDPDRALKDDRVRLYVDLLAEALSIHR